MNSAGFTVFDQDPDVLAWARAAHDAACTVLSDAKTRAAQLRHGETWYVGVDALPNLKDGSISGVPLKVPWLDHDGTPAVWHNAQLSVVYPGYPRQDAEESDANHRYRITRFAAHVDGLLPVGPTRRRFLQEPHAFVLGLPLNISDAAPLMVWPGSHRVMGDAFRRAIGQEDPAQVDLTDTYHAARRMCFDAIAPKPVVLNPGQTVLLHRHLLHGVAPWAAEANAPPEGRMVAYFRPELSDAKRWLHRD